MFGIWRACERFGILPPEVAKSWDKNSVWTQAMLISYDQIRQHDEAKEETNRLKVLAMAAGVGVK